MASRVGLLSNRYYPSNRCQQIYPFTEPAGSFAEVCRSVNVLHNFKQYLKEGFRPIFLEGYYVAKILEIIEKTIFFNVTFLVPLLHENHLRLMNAVMGVSATSPIPTLNIDSLISEWSVGKEKIYQLLEVPMGVSKSDLALMKAKKRAIAKFVRAREEQGLTQAQVAKLVATKQPSVARMEAGQRSEF